MANPTPDEQIAAVQDALFCREDHRKVQPCVPSADIVAGRVAAVSTMQDYAALKERFVERDTFATGCALELAEARVEIAALKERHERALAVVRDAATGQDELARFYDDADAERRKTGEVGSQHRDQFEAWLDNLTEEAKDVLAAESPPTQT